MNAAVQSAPSAGRVQALIWLALFAALVAALGGSARFDAVQIAALRPLAALFLIPAFYYLTPGSVREAKVPLVLLAAITAWTAIQLIPLPPAIWHALPGRGILAELDALQGIGDTWRPISWVPMRGWNALFALVVPIAAALLIVALKIRLRHILITIAALGVIDAALGLMQIVGGQDSPLYLYRYTNAGSPVGIFANENHSSVFSALVLVVIAKLAFTERRRKFRPVFSIGLAAAFLLVVIALLVSGSRAGLGLGLASLVASALMGWIWLARPMPGAKVSAPLAAAMRSPRLVLLIAFAAVAALLFALFQFERAPGVIDAINQNAVDDLRWYILPILREMIATHWIFGTGFGSFDAVYMITEPDEFLSAAYLNQAHNDWAQLIIEGGVPATAIVIALAGWTYASVRSLFSRNPAALVRCVFWVTVIGIFAIASLFDYQLRTPIFQTIGVWLSLGLVMERTEVEKK